MCKLPLLTHEKSLEGGAKKWRNKNGGRAGESSRIDKEEREKKVA